MKIITILTFLFTILFSHDTTELKVGLYNNPPKIFLENEKPSGFFVDIINEIASKENWKLTFVECSWEECLSKLEKGELDIMPDVAYSKDRIDRFTFNKEIVLSSFSLIYSHKNNKITSILDLDGKKIAILKNSVQYNQLKEHLKDFDIQVEYVFTDNFEEAFRLANENKVYGVATSRHFGAYHKKHYDNLIETPIFFSSSSLKFAFPKSNNNKELIDTIDRHLIDLKNNQNSIFDESSKKWLNQAQPFIMPFWLKITVGIAFGVIAVLALIVLFFKYLLTKKTKEVVTKSIQNQKLEQEKLLDYKKMVLSLISMVEQRDSYTAGHSQRVAKYSVIIAKEMGYSDADCELLHEASILHDIGKIAIPDAILLKPEKLTSLEYDIIKEHINVGLKMLQDLPMCKNILDIMKHHHEKYNGSGYPYKLSKYEIPPLSRIIIVADAFDAMTTNRIYRHKKSVSEALEEIVSLNKIHFHPEVVEAAMKALLNVDISSDFSQQPTTLLEEQRFVYFYKDALTDLYNVKFLETTLVGNTDAAKYKQILIISLHKFDLYNKKHGWERGDEVLKSFATLLSALFEGHIIFRVRANDFIILLEDNFDFQDQKNKIAQFVEEKEIEFDIHTYDLQSNEIYSYELLKKFL